MRFKWGDPTECFALLYAFIGTSVSKGLFTRNEQYILSSTLIIARYKYGVWKNTRQILGTLCFSSVKQCSVYLAEKIGVIRHFLKKHLPSVFEKNNNSNQIFLLPISSTLLKISLIFYQKCFINFFFVFVICKFVRM